MKKINSIKQLSKKLLKEQLLKTWDKLLTEKPHGDLELFYQKRAAVFRALPNLEKIIGKEDAQDAYSAMEVIDSVFEDKGVKVLPPPVGGRALNNILMGKSDSDAIVAYLHIPFCKIKCTYCSFFKEHSSKTMEAEYVEFLLQELEQIQNTPYLEGRQVSAVFLGGGTPGTLTSEQLAKILQKVKAVLPLSVDCEITVESSIYDMDLDKLKSCIDSGANRFSFGVQTFATDLRRQLGRPDDCEEVVRKLKLFASTGSKIIIDLIYGLPGQTQASLKQDLQLYLDCGLSGIDLYKLQIFPGTPLGKQFAMAPEKFPQGRELEEIFVSGVEFLQSKNCRQLSYCHWATDARENSCYNQLVKSGAEILAFGAGCGGFLGRCAYMQPRELAKYYKLVRNGVKPVTMVIEKDSYTPIFASIKGQFDRGIFSITQVSAVSGFDCKILLEPLCKRWGNLGLMSYNDENYVLTPKGMFWQNQLSRAVMIALQYLLYGSRIAARKSALGRTNPMENRT